MDNILSFNLEYRYFSSAVDFLGDISKKSMLKKFSSLKTTLKS